MGVNARRVAAVAGSLSLVLAACLAAVALVLQPSGSPTALLNEDTRHLKPSAEVVKQSLQTTEQSYASLHPGTQPYCVSDTRVAALNCSR